MARLRCELIGLALLVLLAVAGPAGAQAGDPTAEPPQSPWSQPVNISQSGAATQPAIAAGSDGVLHALWWDTVAGTYYARVVDQTGAGWSEPVLVDQIVGKREVSELTGAVTIQAPRDLRMQADARGGVYAFWFDTDDRLLAAQNGGGGWGGATALADSALALDVAANPNGGLHLAYIRAFDSPGNPAGVYYRATGGGNFWSAPVLVQASPYFRTLPAGAAHVSLAADGEGGALVTWDDPKLAQSFYARSDSAGQSWSAPQPVSGDPEARTTQGGRAVLSPGGDFFLLWRDARAAGCGLSQRRSTDGGLTWSAPERALAGLQRCPGAWQFAPGGDGRLWLLGVPGSQGTDQGTAGVLAAWDGAAWSEAASVNLSFRDPLTGRPVSLGCLRLALGGTAVGLLGCDAEGDLWAARNLSPLETLAAALKPAWSEPQALLDQSGPAGLPALTGDGQGRLYAVWSQSTGEGLPGVALAAATWGGGQWSRAAQVLRSPDLAASLVSAARPLNKAEQPALAVDGQGRLHVVWSGGTSGEIFYSRAYARDAALPSAWAEPVALPAVSPVGAWPAIQADWRGPIVYVVYAVPYNEARGVYLARSDDGGETWQSPLPVFDAVSAGWEGVDKPQLALDVATGASPAGRLHVAWLRSPLPGGTHPQALFYAASDDGGQTWSAPLQLAEGTLDWPRLAVAAGQAHLVWTQARTGSLARASATFEVWHSFSPDGGARWSEPARARGFDQVSGPPGLATDGSGGFYLVGVGVGVSSESTLLYARWAGGDWAERDRFALGQDATPGNAVAAAVAPSSGALGVILRAFALDAAGNGQFRALGSHRAVPASGLTPPPTFTPLPTLTPTITPTPRPTGTPRPQLSVNSTLLPPGNDALQGYAPLVMGAALVTLLVLLVLANRLLSTRR